MDKKTKDALMNLAAEIVVAPLRIYAAGREAYQKLEESGKIDEAKDKILNTDFEIDPKRVGFNNVSCKYCKYKDICFMNQNNVKILEEIKDLSFLGGDDNANMD